MLIGVAFIGYFTTALYAFSAKLRSEQMMGTLEAMLVTPARLWSALLILPAALLGAWVGHRIHLQLPELTFRRLVAAALFVIGLLLLVPNGAAG